MDTEVVISGLEDLIIDRQSFLSGDPDCDSIIQYDIRVLQAAIKIIRSKEEEKKNEICKHDAAHDQDTHRHDTSENP